MLDCYHEHWNDATHEHIVQPGMVYISNPTEIGSIYHKSELQALAEACRECGLPLFMDGARLGYGLAAQDNDLDLPTITDCCDVFYIGGTKVGRPVWRGGGSSATPPSLRISLQHQAARRHAGQGRLLGIQFAALFEDGLYFEISRHAVRLAMKIRKACESMGYSFVVPSTTNQQFPILPNELIEKLGEKWGYSFWGKIDEQHSAVRLLHKLGER